MEKGVEQMPKKDSAVSKGTGCTNNDEISDKTVDDAGKSSPKGENSTMEISKLSDSVGQSQSSTGECHTFDGADAVGEKRPLEIRYQHHNLRSRLKKIKKDPPVAEVVVPVAPAKKEEKKNTGSPKGEKAKPEKKTKRLKAWLAWTAEDTDDFFEGLCEYGRDFDAIQRHIEKGHLKRGKDHGLIRNKDQVRHLYYRTVHKVSKFIEPRKDMNLKDAELHALINYGEVRRKLKGAPRQKQWRKLSELISNGFATLRINGRNTRLKTPVCKALRGLVENDTSGKEPVKHVRPQKLPAKVTIDLRPCDNATWSAVQSMSYNPRIRLNVCLQKKIASLIRVLSSRMIPDNIKTDRDSKSEPKSGQNIEADMLFQIPENTEVSPYDEICGKYVLDGCRTLINLKPEMIPEGYHITKTLDKDLESALKSESDDKIQDVKSSTQEKDDKCNRPTESTYGALAFEKWGKAEGPKQPVKDTGKAMGSDHAETLKTEDDAGNPDFGIVTFPDVLGMNTVDNSKTRSLPSSTKTQERTTSNACPEFLSGYSQADTTSMMLGKVPLAPGVKRGAPVKSQKTGTVIGSTIMIPIAPGAAASNSSSSDFMHLTSINDVSILQDDDDSSKETTEESGSGEDSGHADLKVFRTKNDILREGLTVNNSDNISLVEVYLMLGKPDKLKFGYKILGEKSEKWKTSSMLSKLVMLAKEEVQKAAQPEKKFVSVGTNTSPVKKEPSPPQPQIVGTPAGKINFHYKPNAAAATPILTQNGQLTLHLNPAMTHINPQVSGEGPVDGKDFQFARPLAPIQVVNTRIGNHNVHGVNGSANMSKTNFLPRKRRGLRGRQTVQVTSSSQLLRQRRAIQPRPIMPNKVIGQIVRAVPTGVPLNLAVSSAQPGGIRNDILTQAALSANIATLKPLQTVRMAQLVKKPVTNINNNQELIGLSPLTAVPGVKVNTVCQPEIQPTSQINPPVSTITISSQPVQPTVSNPPTANLPDLWTMDDLSLTPKSTPQGINLVPSETITSQPRASNEIPDNILAMPTPEPEGLSDLPEPILADPDLSEALCTPKTTPERVPRVLMDNQLSTPKPTNGVLGRAFLNTPVVDKTPMAPGLNVSPPNISSLLDMSLPATDESSQDGLLSGFRVRLEELMKQGEETPSAPSTTAAGSTTNVGILNTPLKEASSTPVPVSLAAALSTAKISVPKGGDSSPFKLGGGNQWLHEESSQNTQMSLGTLLDQLELPNPEKRSTSGTTAHSSLLHTDCSRDSIMSMDTHLQAMLNENSLDYVAKFADLAAHIASPEEMIDPCAGQMLQTEQTLAR